jgi:hypothetical protein
VFWVGADVGDSGVDVGVGVLEGTVFVGVGVAVVG